MNCEELRARLDAYMDGELSDGELREVEAHAATCEDCRREFEAARLMREAMDALPEEVPVPLSAQAGWRSAVRAEAKRRKQRRWLRAGYAVAAALVLALGATAVLRSASERIDVAPVTLAAGRGAVEVESVAAEPTSAVVAKDGEAEEDGVFPIEGETYAAWKKFRTEGGDAHRAACEAVEALAEEYSGSCELLTGGGAAGGTSYYRIELPGEYLEDFLSAIGHVGEELDSEVREPEGEAAIVYIQIEEDLAE